MTTFRSNRVPVDHRQDAAPRPAPADRDGSSIERDRSEAELQELTATIEHLRIALESRDVIGQAKGIIIASTGCSPTQHSRCSSRSPRARTGSSWRSPRS